MIVMSASSNSVRPEGSKPTLKIFYFKPSEAWGSAYCAIDDGHKIVAQFSDSLKLSKGLKFELYRYKSTERYTINYVEITVYQNSDS